MKPIGMSLSRLSPLEIGTSWEQSDPTSPFHPQKTLTFSICSIIVLSFWTPFSPDFQFQLLTLQQPHQSCNPNLVVVRPQADHNPTLSNLISDPRPWSVQKRRNLKGRGFGNFLKGFRNSNENSIRVESFLKFHFESFHNELN